MTTNHSTTASPLRQAILQLHEVEDRLRGAYGYPAVTAPQVERITRIVAKALDDLDYRLTRTEQVEDVLARKIDNIDERLGQVAFRQPSIRGSHKAEDASFGVQKEAQP
ncbi:MAG: hypothetical protein Q7O66_15535 [Dehalococcoidia bacterium]|nr:hypothetical protein [Dehalococcoidia bacterium]